MSLEVQRLLEAGWVTPRAIAHAEAVSRRGHSLVPIADLLVELEHVDPEDLARVRTEHAPIVLEAPRTILETEDDSAIVRLVNGLLLGARGPGRMFRVERDGIRGGANGRFDDWMALDARVVDVVLARLRLMADVPSKASTIEGAISIRTPTSDHAYQTFFEATDEGARALVRRQSSWRGHETPYTPQWNAYRRARDASGDAVACARALVREAQALGDEAAIEHVLALAGLGAALDQAGAHDEASATATRALDLASAHELGVRAMSMLAAHAASMECRDLARRVSLFDRAEAWMRAPGVGRGRCVWLPLDLAMSERVRGHHEAALAAAARALADDEEWIGATTRWGVRAMLESTLAHAALGNLARARTLADEAARVGTFVGAPAFEIAWARAAVGDGAAAVRAWERAIDARAHDEGADDAPFLALGLARALDRADRSEDARGAARRALGESSAGLGAAARPELEAIAARAPYR